jgi:hypothetical protein
LPKNALPTTAARLRAEALFLVDACQASQQRQNIVSIVSIVSIRRRVDPSRSDPADRHEQILRSLSQRDQARDHCTEGIQLSDRIGSG